LLRTASQAWATQRVAKPVCWGGARVNAHIFSEEVGMVKEGLGVTFGRGLWGKGGRDDQVRISAVCESVEKSRLVLFKVIGQEQPKEVLEALWRA